MGRTPDTGMQQGGARRDGPKERLRHLGAAAGFCAVGVARAERLDTEAPHLEAWLEAGYQGTMAWMARDPERRLDPHIILPEARSVLVGAMYYRHDDHAATLSGQDGDESHPRISCYAWGEDYHRVVGEALVSWAEAIGAEFRSFVYKAVCDTSAVMEKSWAAKAGVGWLGKNGCLIHPRHGSWVFLGLLITNLDLEPDMPAPGRCGRCSRCIDACPTGAIVRPGVVDSRRCISYRTIEHRGPFSADYGHRPIGNWLAGCDLCQEVCPWNVRAAGRAAPRFRPITDLISVPALDWLEMSDREIRTRLKGTALSRVKPHDMRRNARAVLGTNEDASA